MIPTIDDLQKELSHLNCSTLSEISREVARSIHSMLTSEPELGKVPLDKWVGLTRLLYHLKENEVEILRKFIYEKYNIE